MNLEPVVSPLYLKTQAQYAIGNNIQTIKDFVNNGQATD